MQQEVNAGGNVLQLHLSVFIQQCQCTHHNYLSPHTSLNMPLKGVVHQIRSRTNCIVIMCCQLRFSPYIQLCPRFNESSISLSGGTRNYYLTDLRALARYLSPIVDVTAAHAALMKEGCCMKTHKYNHLAFAAYR
jgi:hypothetical protein